MTTLVWMVSVALADVPPPTEPPAAAAVDPQQAFLAGLRWQDGDIALGDDLAMLHLPPELHYLSPVDTDRLLQAWGNPPTPATLGAIFPTAVSPFDDASWCFVLDYEADGHVSDDDANSIDYDALLTSLKADAEAANPERKAAGYDEVHLVGWAAAPRYEAASHTMYWAKELHFANSPTNTLNYNVRVLGRDGVLTMSGIGSAAQLATIQQQSAPVLSAVAFNPGRRYEDFVPGSDSTAAYGLAGLVAGGAVVAKTGVGKGLLAMLFASKKLLVAGGIAAVAAVRGVLGMAKKDDPPPSA